jgi:hypothetical protein
MRKLIIALLAALAVAAFAVACGDDDDDNGDGSPTETSTTATAKPSRTGDAVVTPAGGDVKTPSNETPGEDETPEPTGTGPRPTPAAEGIPATLIEDPNGFFSSNYPGKSPTQSECAFSPLTYVVSCGSDKYAPDPPLRGQDVTCALLSVDDAPVAIRCNSQEPLQAIYYEIQE